MKISEGAIDENRSFGREFGSRAPGASATLPGSPRAARGKRAGVARNCSGRSALVYFGSVTWAPEPDFEQIFLSGAVFFLQASSCLKSCSNSPVAEHPVHP
jgi:hypothetical protein